MTSNQIGAKSLGINLHSGKEPELYKWFLACLLFGKPIQQEIAKRAYELIINAGLTSINKLAKADWDLLVNILDEAHYVHYDFSTATKLLQIAKTIKEKYRNVSGLLKRSTNALELSNQLLAINGIGTVTKTIFIREIMPIFFKTILSHDYESAIRAATIINHRGFEAYIVGGAVRDLLLGRQPKDFDLVTNATPEQIMDMPEFKESSYKDTAQAFGVTRVSFPNNDVESELEIATFRKDIEAHLGRKATKVEFADLESDVLRRDFTINALALDISTNQVIDYVGGIDDLNNGCLRFIGQPEQRIKEDPLRLMRAIRFKNQLNFSYHPQTVRAIKIAVEAGYVEKIATDRLCAELTDLLTHSSRCNALRDLDEFGILGRILPEIVAGKGIEQPRQYHAEGDVWQHQLLIMSYLPEGPSKRLVWAALLHDIGKAPTRSFSGGRLRFNRHHAVGAEMAKAVLQRLNFSNRDSKDICWMIYNHMSINDLPQMRPSLQQSMFGNPAFEDLLELHRADAASSWRPNRSRVIKPKFREIERLWHLYQLKKPERQQPSLKRDLGIDGHWLIRKFQKEFSELNGPIIGKILDELNDWYRDEGVKDRKAYTKKARLLIEKEIKPNRV